MLALFSISQFGLRWSDAEEISQVNFRIDAVRDLALIEETRQIGFTFHPVTDVHTQGEELTHVFYQRTTVLSLQTLLPTLAAALVSVLKHTNTHR